MDQPKTSRQRLWNAVVIPAQRVWLLFLQWDGREKIKHERQRTRNGAQEEPRLLQQRGEPSREGGPAEPAGVEQPQTPHHMHPEEPALCMTTAEDGEDGTERMGWRGDAAGEKTPMQKSQP